MDEIQKLVARIDALAESTSRSRSTISRLVFGGGARVDEIAAGSSITLATLEKAKAELDRLEQMPPSAAA